MYKVYLEKLGKLWYNKVLNFKEYHENLYKM
jgi:hypothetical protein